MAKMYVRRAKFQGLISKLGMTRSDFRDFYCGIDGIERGQVGVGMAPKTRETTAVMKGDETAHRSGWVSQLMKVSQTEKRRRRTRSPRIQR